jgi:hypothetical protein
MDQQQSGQQGARQQPLYDISNGGHYGASAAVRSFGCASSGWTSHLLKWSRMIFGQRRSWRIHPDAKRDDARFLRLTREFTTLSHERPRHADVDQQPTTSPMLSRTADRISDAHIDHPTGRQSHFRYGFIRLCAFLNRRTDD